MDGNHSALKNVGGYVILLVVDKHAPLGYFVPLK